MGINFDDVVSLLYHQVKVITKFNRGSDSRSKFIINNQDEEEKTDTCGKVKEKLAFVGYLKVIDPTTRTAILCYIKNNLVEENLLILGQVISHVEIYCPDNCLPPKDVKQIVEKDNASRAAKYLFNNEEKYPQLTSEEVIKRRDTILLWLSKNRIPSAFESKTNDIILDETVRIKAPYTHQSDYVCPTRVTLMRVQQIINSMPEIQDKDD